MDTTADRLDAAGAALVALRPELEAGEPWPLSAAYGTEPEAEWGPREVLAHVDEMLGYWTAELERVVAGEGRAPVPFGRTASDPDRLACIERDRGRLVGGLLDEIDAGIRAAASFARRLSGDDLARVGAHPTRGELTVAASLDRFLTTHLEEHVAQVRSILADVESR
ncbi:MAG TPA: DinB family protein [Candidatus Limnocylindrales bacterium]|jgi:hypothetical protein